MELRNTNYWELRLHASGAGGTESFTRQESSTCCIVGPKNIERELQTSMYEINKQQGNIAQHREIRAFLVAQLVKNLPVMQETWVRFLGSEDPLEKGKATHSSILARRIPWTV